MAHILTMTPTQTQATVVIDRSVKSLQKTLADIIKSTGELATLTEITAAQALQIEDSNLQLKELAAQVEEARRTAAAELKLQVLEDARKVFVELAGRLGFAQVTTGELELLNSQLAIAQRDYSKELADIQASLRTQYEKETNARLKAQESEHAIASARKDADLTARDSEILFLKQQVAYLQQQITEERTTRLEVAKADANKQGVTVNTGK